MYKATSFKKKKNPNHLLQGCPQVFKQMQWVSSYFEGLCAKVYEPYFGQRVTFFK